MYVHVHNTFMYGYEIRKCTYACVYMYIIFATSIHTCVGRHMYDCHGFVSSPEAAHIHVYMYVDILCVCMHTFIYVCACIHICTCVICLHTCIYMSCLRYKPMTIIQVPTNTNVCILGTNITYTQTYTCMHINISYPYMNILCTYTYMYIVRMYAYVYMYVVRYVPRTYMYICTKYTHICVGRHMHYCHGFVYD